MRFLSHDKNNKDFYSLIMSQKMTLVAARVIFQLTLTAIFAVSYRHIFCHENSFISFIVYSLSFKE